ncbi:hypothetical protein QAD02_009323 [Eretmocerus hayati]|uniref:Uncharacterized protein n=1 Tax=Eretmocerus hayati TaxID=131215 RepID=A0ACC2N914_9HYME|nr:hypothetical protein QAD02_009323 [Eretmocerus hayati]
MTRPNIILILGIVIFGFFNDVENRIGIGGSEQEWGFVEVRPGAHMFWWLFYVTGSINSTFYEKPLLIWLEGGPGLSSTGTGNFDKIGPLDGKQNHRNHSWVKDYNVLFIDSPVGAGFSYVKNKTLLCKTDAEVVEDLLTFMNHFYKNIPKFRDVPVYLLGESYGGKIVVNFASGWYKNQRSSTNLGNLKGIAVGGAWISPIDSMSAWAPYLLQIGLIDSSGSRRIDEKVNQIIEAIKTKKWNAIDELVASALEIIWSETRGVDFYNVLEKVSSKSLISGKLIDFDSPDTEKEAMFAKFIIALTTTNSLMNGIVRKSLGINQTWTGLSQDVHVALGHDFAKPATRCGKAT